MRTAISFLILALVFGAAATAHADAHGRATYPFFVADRPTLLPPLTAQITGETEVTNLDGGATGVAVGFGFDLGIVRRLQVGAFIAAPVYPHADFGIFDLNLQVGLTRGLNLRIDTGVLRSSVASDSGHNHADGFLAAFSLPWRGRLHRIVSLYGWSPAARAINTQPIFVARDGSRLYGAGLFTDTLFGMSVFHTDDGSTSLYGSLLLPLGITIQPVAPISFGLRSGYRLLFQYSSVRNTVTLAHYVPLVLDFTVHIGRLVDLGFTATFQGPVGTNTVTIGPDWADVRQFDLWVAGRF